MSVVQWLGSGEAGVDIGTTLASSIGTVITASGSANTKGSWSQLVASTTSNSNFALFMITSNNLNAQWLVDLGVGTAGNEKVVISNLLFSSSPLTSLNVTLGFPLSIAKGARVAARVQGTSGGSSIFTSMITTVGAWAFPSFASSFQTYGAVTASTSGTTIDPGAVINTKGSYTQITAATTKSCKGLLVCIGNRNNVAQSLYRWLVDIAIGAGGSEKVIVPNFQLASGISRSITPYLFFVPVTIPAGTRLAARAQCSGNDATDRLFDIVLIGVS